MCISRYNALLTDSTWPGHVICMGGLKVRCDRSTDGLKKTVWSWSEPPVHTLFHGTIFSSHTYLAPMQCWMGRVAKSPTELLQSRSAGHARDELHHQVISIIIIKIVFAKIYDNLSHYEGHNTSFYTKSIFILIPVWRRHEGHCVASQTLDCWRGLPDVYQTKVRSMSILVTNSLTNSLTDWLPFTKLGANCLMMS